MHITARSQSLVRCSTCHQLNHVPDAQAHYACARCGSVVKQRAQPQLQQVWALLLAAMTLYLPANLLPVMNVINLGQSTQSTIISGIIQFLQSGSWILALIIFIASILIPLLKMLVLAGLLISVQWGYCAGCVEKTKLYRLIEFIGRWSMVDVFVIALLVALVQFGEFAYIQVGAGTLSFAGVVLLTIWATKAFDIRWLWDKCAQQEEPTND